MTRATVRKIGNSYFLLIPMRYIKMFNLLEKEFSIDHVYNNIYITLLKDDKLCCYTKKIASKLNITFEEAEKEYMIPFHNLLISNEKKIQIKAAEELIFKLKKRYIENQYSPTLHIDKHFMYTVFKLVLKGFSIENYIVIIELVIEQLEF